MKRMVPPVGHKSVLQVLRLMGAQPARYCTHLGDQRVLQVICLMGAQPALLAVHVPGQPLAKGGLQGGTGLPFRAAKGEACTSVYASGRRSCQWIAQN